MLLGTYTSSQKPHLQGAQSIIVPDMFATVGSLAGGNLRAARTSCSSPVGRTFISWYVCSIVMPFSTLTLRQYCPASLKMWLRLKQEPWSTTRWHLSPSSRTHSDFISQHNASGGLKWEEQQGMGRGGGGAARRKRKQWKLHKNFTKSWWWITWLK